MKYYMHVNFLEHVFPIPEIVRRCAAAGYDGIELRGFDVGGEIPLQDYLARVGKTVRDNRLELVLGCRNDTFPDAPAARSRSLEDLKTIIRFSADHGVRILNVFAGPVQAHDTPYTHFEKHGSAIVTPEQWRQAVEYFQEAGDIAGPLGIDLCFETHNVYLHDLGEPTRRLLDSIGRPNVKANLDYGNILINRANQGFEKELTWLEGRIGYVHLKNLVSLNAFDSRSFFSTPLDGGDINNYVLIRKLLQSGYKGPLTIENCMNGDKRSCLYKDLAYLRSIIEDLAVCH